MFNYMLMNNQIVLQTFAQNAREKEIWFFWKYGIEDRKEGMEFLLSHCTMSWFQLLVLG